MIVSRRVFLVTVGGTALAALGGPTPASAAIRGIDHLVIMFKELETAVQSYRDLGFAVSPGGEHPRGTHNALVALADGSVLELIAFKRPNDQHFWWDVAQAGGGFIDFCAASDDVAADVQAFRKVGVEFKDPLPGGRVRTDGYKLSWIAAFPAKPFMFQVPFFLQHITPREEVIPEQNRHPNHPNGVTGIASITVATENVAQVRGWWSPVLHQPGTEIQHDKIDAAGVRFVAGTHALDFVGPRSASSPVNAWLKARGPSPYGIVLKTNSGKTGPLDEAKAGTRITLV